MDGASDEDVADLEFGLLEEDGDFSGAAIYAGPEAGVLPGRMLVVAYLVSKYAPYYRLVLDVLLEEEARLGLHLTTAEIERRVWTGLGKDFPSGDLPDVESLLDRLFRWGNVNRIHNTRRKGTAAEYLRRDYLYQLTPAGAEVHRTLRRIDAELGGAGKLQATMLGAVLGDLHSLARALGTENPDKAPDLRAALKALSQIGLSFTELSDNAKRFVQGLNRNMEDASDLDKAVFIAYKNDVVVYLQDFVMALVRYSSPISGAILAVEERGLRGHFLDLAKLEAAPILGLSSDEVQAREAERLRLQWEGIRGWFFGEADQPPVTTALHDRAADAVSRIVSTVRRFNEARFRRIDRTTDLLTLSQWFAETADPLQRATLWRNAFGMYPARHFGAAHDIVSDFDVRPNLGWWETPAAPVDPRLREQGPRASSGRPNRLKDPRERKRRLAARRAAALDARERVIARLTGSTPARVSALPTLSAAEADLFLECLRLALAVHADASGTRRTRTSDGRLAITLRPAPDAFAVAEVQTVRGALAMEDFEIDIVDRHKAAG